MSMKLICARRTSGRTVGRSTGRGCWWTWKGVGRFEGGGPVGWEEGSGAPAAPLRMSKESVRREKRRKSARGKRNAWSEKNTKQRKKNVVGRKRRSVRSGKSAIARTKTRIRTKTRTRTASATGTASAPAAPGTRTERTASAIARTGSAIAKTGTERTVTKIATATERTPERRPNLESSRKLKSMFLELMAVAWNRWLRVVTSLVR
mmetsp:Transcript_15409/g.20345  ORF Transcript_15409/g.20345 Transcript_15409/m.20345 type:complete len:206 (-) Transcript_15409:690-1307(-)